MDDKILDRIKKMMALGECMGTTEHERDTAMKQAYKLLAKYNLTVADVEARGQKDKEPRDTYKVAGWSLLWARSASSAIADLFFCEHYTQGKINATKTYHCFVGKESNARTAIYMSDFIVSAILKEGRSRFGSNLCAETRNFALGCVDRLWTRVGSLKKEAAVEETPGNALALISLYKSESDANIALLPEKMKTSRGSKVTDVSSYREGQAFGNTLSLAPQIGQTKGASKQLK